MKRRQRLLSNQADDRGAALLLVLILVTVVALAGAAMLSFSDTSLRTTVALRDQGAGAYAADGAAQVAISELQNGSFPNDCATLAGDDGLALGSGTQPFYQSAQSSSTALNAYVSCVPDPSTGNPGIINSANKPKNAIWTVDNPWADSGQGYNFSSGKPIKVANGNVISETSINIGSSTFAVTGTDVKILANSQCWKNSQGQFSPTACVKNATLDPRPSYPAPTGNVTLAPAPVCTTGKPSYAAFSPGLYTNVDILNGNKHGGNKNLCGAADVVWFMPGTYYFDFSGTWNAPSRLVGGTPTDSTGAPIANPSLGNLNTLNKASTGACVDPRLGSPALGVEFVFGGSSKIYLGSNLFEICATYSAGSVPIAIYGLTANIPAGPGSLGVSEQDVCYWWSCSSMLSTDNAAEFHIQGFTYAPNAGIALDLQDSLGGLFNWGLMLSTFSLQVQGDPPTQPFVSLPQISGTTSYPVSYLSVWVCPAAASSCDRSGPARLTAKVQVAPPLPVKVLSWSVQR